MRLSMVIDGARQVVLPLGFDMSLSLVSNLSESIEHAEAFTAGVQRALLRPTGHGSAVDMGCRDLAVARRQVILGKREPSISPHSAAY